MSEANELYTDKIISVVNDVHSSAEMAIHNWCVKRAEVNSSDPDFNRWLERCHVLTEYRVDKDLCESICVILARVSPGADICEELRQVLQSIHSDHIIQVEAEW